MSNPPLTIESPVAAPPPRPDQLGQILLRRKVISGSQLQQAVQLQERLGLRIGDICVSQGWTTSAEVLQALSEQRGLQRIDLTRQIPDRRLFAARSARFWLRHRAVPRTRLGDRLMIAAASPENLDQIASGLGCSSDDIVPVLADEDQITGLIAQVCQAELAQGASTRVAGGMSCRGRFKPRRGLSLPLFLLGLICSALAAPKIVFSLGCLAAFACMMLFVILKGAGFAAFLCSPPPARPGSALPATPLRLPRISVLVPLFREEQIAAKLIRRLSALTYPPALLDVLLVLEDHDDITRKTIADCQLPPWMQVIEVPAHGGLTTKPRALNYALDFCKGEIIGVWDAEDAPAPNQLDRVARRFHRAPPETVCLQGVLDYYNPTTNWLSRCFSIEYASWFRVVMPGIERLGLVLPLGGTTMFIRRQALEAAGGWDAHNVTEDADLGVRLARAGHRTEMLNTTTFEEATFRPWPWVRQRSRWLKGFMVTYVVHMRRPGQLLRDLGWRQFLGLNAFFLGTLGHFLLAPFLWSFWLLLFSLPHPAAGQLPQSVLLTMGAAMLVFELLAAAIAIVAVQAAERIWLAPWVVTMPLYYPLGVLAAYKALYELFCRPYFWDKTTHGSSSAAVSPPQE